MTLIFFIIRVSLPVISTEENLPEYSEYLRRKYIRSTVTTPAPTTSSAFPVNNSSKPIEEQAPVSALFPPLFQLCKDRPDDENTFYKQAVCWALFALYLMVIVSLVLHQLCSIFWLKVNDNGQWPDQQNFEGAKHTYTAGLSRLFRK